MTEEKTKEIQTEMGSESNGEQLGSWGNLVTKSHVRLKIWQILKLFGELNVTQISNLLKESKSTVSRHLNGMEDDMLVVSREDESCCEGRIAPKLFSINHVDKKMKVGMDQVTGVPKDPEERVEFIKSEILTNRSSIAMMNGIMKLLLPLYDEVENLLKDGTEESKDKAFKIFDKYMWGDDGENITWFKFNYLNKGYMDLDAKIHKLAWKAMKDDYDPIAFEEERVKLKTELKDAKTEQKDQSIPKRYGVFGITMPLRKIFKRNAKKN